MLIQTTAMVSSTSILAGNMSLKLQIAIPSGLVSHQPGSMILMVY